MDDGIAFGKSRADSFPEQVDFLLDLVDRTRDIPGAIVEIGSWKCGCSIAIASANPTKMVYAFDLFGGLPYGKGHGFENFGTTDWEEIQAATKPYQNLVLHRGLHEETVPTFAAKDWPLSLIFMDSDHYSSHRIALKKLIPLLSSGGIIAFHDWTFPAVQQAIREYVDPSKFIFEPNDVRGMRAIRAL